jgi:tRNA threonylcarbamoyladenosine biosynthesis protein TsaE
MMRVSPWVGGAVFGALLLFAAPALADKVLVLPFQGVGSALPGELEGARAAAIAAVIGLAHKLPTPAETVTAQAAVGDGVADTSEEYLAAGRASSSDWTVGGHFEAYGATYHLELEACQIASGRVESLAREIDPSVATKQMGEMLALLLRPQGIANAEIPWERVTISPALPKPPPPLPAPPPPSETPPPPPAIRHRYAENQPIALGLRASVLGALHRPLPAGAPASDVGSSLAGMLGGTFGYALAAVSGLELCVDGDGSIAGPRSFGLAGGARYAIPILPTLRVFAGAEAEMGTFVTLAGDKTARFLVRGAAFFALGLGEHLQLELAADIDYAAGSTTLVLGGGTLGALVRFWALGHVGRTVALSTRRDTLRLGGRIALALRAGDLVLLSGGLGAGKTFLARAIARALGVRSDVAITSPTFTLVQEYGTKKGNELLHADLYRLLEGTTPLEVEIERLGLRERRARGAIVLAEWADDGEAALGGSAELRVALGIEGARVRRAVMEGVRAAEVT